jgi:hypothetical protein
MGKTTLATAAVHHPAIVEKYGLIHFISCESATTCADLVTSIGSYLGLEPSTQLSKRVVQHFEQCGPCLVVFDNFETPWEPVESREQVEQLLSLLADIQSLALLVGPPRYDVLRLTLTSILGYNQRSRTAGSSEMEPTIPPSPGNTLSFSFAANIR